MTLKAIGLHYCETNYFMTFWMTVLNRNKVSAVSFQGGEYNDVVPLVIIPQSDSICYVFVAVKHVDDVGNFVIEPQVLPQFQHHGFSV
jgi:hypothetical protein